MAAVLDIVTCVSNPIQWDSRIDLARKAIANWLKEPNVRVTVVECQFGDREWSLDDLESDPRVTHVKVKATTLVWNKESLLNIGIQRAPLDAKYFGTFDADILFRKPGWATDCINTLHLYPVAQPWRTAYDLGPNDENLAVHRSFCSVYHSGDPVAPTSKNFWKHDNGPYDYPHSGYAWVWTREILDRMGGLFELGGMGSGDHHMALGMAGKADWSLPEKITDEYKDLVKRWEARAKAHINGKIGFINHTIEHLFHGTKAKRNYIGRWEMFFQHLFNPHTDLKKNTYGVIEFAGNKPELEQAFDRYLRSRNEDVNSL